MKPSRFLTRVSVSVGVVAIGQEFRAEWVELIDRSEL